MSREVLEARQALRAFELEQLAKPSGLRNWTGHGALAAALRLAERAALVPGPTGACPECAAPGANGEAR